MKKTIIPLLALAALALFAACDTKKCYCYENGREYVDYVSPDQRCATLTHGDYGCVEINERLSPEERNGTAEDKARRAAASAE